MKYDQIIQPTETQFSQWVTPNRKYKLQCCDCGLVHDMQFIVLLKAGRKLDRRKGQIKFRVRKNDKATMAVRRNKS